MDKPSKVNGHALIKAERNTYLCTNCERQAHYLKLMHGKRCAFAETDDRGVLETRVAAVTAEIAGIQVRLEATGSKFVDKATRTVLIARQKFLASRQKIDMSKLTAPIREECRGTILKSSFMHA